LDPEALKRMIRPNTKVIIVNVPHNPTGYVMPLAEWQALVDLARQSGIYILADEVYRFLEHAPLTPLPSMVDMYERGIAIGSMSKAFAMPGLRLGWVATQDTALLNAIAAFKDYTSICINAPGAFLAELALVHKETIFARNHAILDHNRQVLSDFLNAHRSTFNWVPPQAGATVFVGLNAGQSSERFCAQLLAQQNVLLLPSRYYDYPDGFFRLGFGARNFPAVLQKLAAFLESAHLSV
jgi:aspartate/methionine/tyrosine aminotransferase